MTLYGHFSKRPTSDTSMTGTYITCIEYYASRHVHVASKMDMENYLLKVVS